MSDEQGRRLRWQCRRGMRELDLLLLDFVDQHYDALSIGERATLDALLNNPDQLLQAWLLGHQPPTDPAMARLVERIRGLLSASPASTPAEAPLSNGGVAKAPLSPRERGWA